MKLLICGHGTKTYTNHGETERSRAGSQHIALVDELVERCGIVEAAKQRAPSCCLYYCEQNRSTSRLSEAKPSIPRPRIEGLSDLIFGLALSIGAIQLIGSAPQTNTQLVISVGAFGFSFLILIGIWNRYTTLTSVLPVESVLMVRLNMLLLFLVAIEPFLFNLLVAQSNADVSLEQYVSSYYALDIGAMNVVLAYFSHLLIRQEKGRITTDVMARFKRSRNVCLVTAFMFIVSALPFFWTIAFLGVEGRFLIWILTIPAIRIAHTHG
jgi:uncharacterized membrane protein